VGRGHLPLRALEARATGRRVGHAGFALTTTATLALATVLWRFHWLHAVVPLAHDAARESSYALPHRTHLSPWLFAAAYAAAYAWLLREASRGRARSGLALALLLVALPYLIAWYVLWPLALSARDDDAQRDRHHTRAVRISAAAAHSDLEHRLEQRAPALAEHAARRERGEHLAAARGDARA